MNLQRLILWVQKNQNLEVLNKLVRRDTRGNPVTNDVNIGLKMLGEIKKRAQLVEDHLKKAQKYQEDISEYLIMLDKRGIRYPKETSRSTDIVDHPPLEEKEKSRINEPDSAIHRSSDRELRK